MAQRYYGLNNTDEYRQEKVTTGTSTGSTDVEIRIDDTKGWNHQKLKLTIDALVRRITSGTNDLNTL